MNLVVDIGNSFTKTGLFNRGTLVETAVSEGEDTALLLNFCELHPEITQAIVASVKDYPEQTISRLREKFPVLNFTPATRVPVFNRYETPETLGCDRLASVVAARKHFPKNNVLVIDAGTAITYELLTAAGEYLGGAISPGIRMRYKALHTFTGQLPLLNVREDCMLTGSSTAGSIHSGVLHGSAAEMRGMITAYRRLYPGLKVLLTGGDYKYFDKQLKIKTFAAPNLVLEGLNLILDFNFETI
jgi:type III pantothenate kinase